MGAGIAAGVEIKIKIKQGTVISSKIIFFFFDKRNSILIDTAGDSIIIISSASEILALEVGLIYY